MKHLYQVYLGILWDLMRISVKRLLDFLRIRSEIQLCTLKFVKYILFIYKINHTISQVFPLKGEILKPQEQMERHVTDLVKKVSFFTCHSLCIILVVIFFHTSSLHFIIFQSLQDVTGAEFKMFMDFLSNLSIFGETAPSERIQELIEIIEGQADLDAQFSVCIIS